MSCLSGKDGVVGIKEQEKSRDQPSGSPVQAKTQHPRAWMSVVFPRLVRRLNMKKFASPSDLQQHFIPFPKALSLLVDRLNATSHEVAAWVWSGPEDGGLAAYTNANELGSSRRFWYGEINEGDFDYLSPLNACWFRKEDITKFDPTDRYVTGKELIDRWKDIPGLRPTAFIGAKIEESRLLDIHPICGGTQADPTNDESCPPLEEALFVLSQVEEIEQIDFGKEWTVLLRNSNLSTRQPSPTSIIESVPLESGKLHPLHKFHSLTALRFKEIQICIDSDSLVLRVTARNIRTSATFLEIGLIKRNSLALSSAGEALMQLARKDFNANTKGAQRAMVRLSKVLRDSFRTKDSPFLKCKPQFMLTVPKG